MSCAIHRETLANVEAAVLRGKKGLKRFWRIMWRAFDGKKAFSNSLNNKIMRNQVESTFIEQSDKSDSRDGSRINKNYEKHQPIDNTTSIQFPPIENWWPTKFVKEKTSFWKMMSGKGVSIYQ